MLTMIILGDKFKSGLLTKEAGVGKEKLYNPLIHQDPAKVKIRLIEYLRANVSISEEYRLDLAQFANYLGVIFINLPTRVIKHMMDRLLLSGGFPTERDENNRWVVIVSQKSHPICHRQKSKEFSAKEKLLSFISKCQTEGGLNIMSFAAFCRKLTSALSADARFKQYTKISRDLGFSENGQNLPETILEHTGIDTPLLGGLMLGIEKEAGTVLSYDKLPLAFTLHDIPEGISLKGDVDWNLKTREDDSKEDDALSLMLSIFPKASAKFYDEAFAIVRESEKIKRGGAPLNSVSEDAQFFFAVEAAGYLARALYEVKAGNLAFGNTFWNQEKEIAYFCDKFSSFKFLIEPYIPFIEEFRRKYPDAAWNFANKKKP